MKTLIRLSKLIFLSSILGTALQAQIPNPGFENWTSGNPDGWLTTNFPPLIVNVTQSNDSHTGSWAVRGEVIDFMFPIPPILNTGSLTSPGFPISDKITGISGFYKFSPVGGDIFLVAAEVGVATASDTTIIGSGVFSIGAAVSQYDFFSLDIIYFDTGIPNWANITISIIDTSGTTSGHVGSTMWADDFDIIVGIDDIISDNPTEYELYQNYPNPFNPSTIINYQVPELSFVTLRVYDVLGSEIETLVNKEKPMGSYTVEFSAQNLPSGVYFYQLKAGDFIQTKKMVLMK